MTSQGLLPQARQLRGSRTNLHCGVIKHDPGGALHVERETMIVPSIVTHLRGTNVEGREMQWRDKHEDQGLESFQR